MTKAADMEVSDAGSFGCGLQHTPQGIIGDCNAFALLCSALDLVRVMPNHACPVINLFGKAVKAVNKSEFPSIHLEPSRKQKFHITQGLKLMIPSPLRVPRPLTAWSTGTQKNTGRTYGRPGETILQ